MTGIRPGKIPIRVWEYEAYIGIRLVNVSRRLLLLGRLAWRIPKGVREYVRQMPDMRLSVGPMLRACLICHENKRADGHDGKLCFHDDLLR
jgi:hypothetical protein